MYLVFTGKTSENEIPCRNNEFLRLLALPINYENFTFV
jgi:hypothetical protein